MPEEQRLAGFDDPMSDSDARVADTRPMPAGSSPEIKSLLGVVVAVVIVAGLYFARDVLIPITLAVMLSFLLSPMVTALERLRFWRGPAVMLTVLFALGTLALLGTVIGNQASSLSAEVPGYARTIENKVEGLQGFAADKFEAITRAIGGKLPPPPPVVRQRARSITIAVDPNGQRQPLPVQVMGNESSPLTIARTVLQPVLGPLETLIIVVAVAIFVLMQKEDLRDRFIRVFGSSDLHRTTLALDDAGHRLSRYFLSQLTVNTSFGLVIGLGLWLIGIPAPAMWGILAGLLRFVPYVGAFLAAIAPIALGAAIDPGWSTAIYVALLFVVIEPLTGYVVEPLLYGHSTGLSPVSVIVAAVFWTWVWGPIGLILSTPLTLCLVVMGRHVKSLEFFDVLLGDRPALTNVESFYQRILADDPDEALAQAESLLGNQSLGQYYDEVVLPALRLAAEDWARGRLIDGRARRMARAMMGIIGDLADYARSVETVPVSRWIVAFIEGRGPFDPIVNAMLVQLLAQRGIESRVIANDTVSRDGIARTDLSDVAVFLLSSFEPGGTSAPMRYLVRRLRQSAPRAAIIVGAWSGRELADREECAAVEADATVTTLWDAVERAAQDEVTKPSA
jgi:predicted PurR-regulated permease PerM